MDGDILGHGRVELAKLVRAADNESLGKDYDAELNQIELCRLRLLEAGTPEADQLATMIALAGVNVVCLQRDPEQALGWLKTAIGTCEEVSG